MKTGMPSIRELLVELDRQQHAKKDYIAAENQLRMESVPTFDKFADAPTSLTPALILENAKASERPIHFLRNHAHRQIAQHLDIPQRYYDRMRAADPELLSHNVNTWFERQSEKSRRMIRTMDGDVRAFLSDRYQRIENTEIARVALPILADVPDMQVVSCEVTETRMYLKAVFPRIQGEVKIGDVVQSGVCISNSEVGSGAVSVQPFMYRLRWLNGMISQDDRFRAFHLGAAAKAGESVYELLSDEARAADDKAILLKVRDVVTATASEEYFAKRVERLRTATEEKLQGSVVAAVEVLAQQERLSEGEKGDILRHLIEGGDLSRWGLANAVTRAAHDPASYDRATELEALGGKVIDLAASQWREIAKAA